MGVPILSACEGGGWLWHSFSTSTFITMGGVLHTKGAKINFEVASKDETVVSSYYAVSDGGFSRAVLFSAVDRFGAQDEPYLVNWLSAAGTGYKEICAYT